MTHEKQKIYEIFDLLERQPNFLTEKDLGLSKNRSLRLNKASALAAAINNFEA